MRWREYGLYCGWLAATIVINIIVFWMLPHSNSDLASNYFNGQFPAKFSAMTQRQVKHVTILRPPPNKCTSMPNSDAIKISFGNSRATAKHSQLRPENSRSLGICDRKVEVIWQVTFQDLTITCNEQPARGSPAPIFPNRLKMPHHSAGYCNFSGINRFHGCVGPQLSFSSPFCATNQIASGPPQRIGGPKEHNREQSDSSLRIPILEKKVVDNGPRPYNALKGYILGVLITLPILAFWHFKS